VFVIPSIPIAAGVAIFRYRLYDIDHIINRTLVYATLTGVLVGVYVGGVVLLQTLFRSLTGGESTLAIVASTLAIAALFNPCVGASRRLSIVASTARSTTRGRRWRPSRRGCATKPIWRPWRVTW